MTSCRYSNQIRYQITPADYSALRARLASAAPEETGESLHDKLAEAGARLAARTLEELAAGTLQPQKQGDSPTPYAKMLDKKMGNIDWTRPASEIERLVRGLNSWPSAYTHWNGKVMKIWKTGVKSAQSGDTTQQAAPGTILEVEKDSFSVQTGDGVLVVQEVQLPGKKHMEVQAFLRGNTVVPGTVLASGD